MKIEYLYFISESSIGLLYEVGLIKTVGFFKKQTKQIKLILFIRKDYNSDNKFIGYDREAIESLNFDNNFGTHKITNDVIKNLYTAKHLRDLILHDYEILKENGGPKKLVLNK